MRLFAPLLLAVLVAGSASAQPDQIFPPPPSPDSLGRYGSGAGVTIHLTEFGFGLGALARARVGPSTSSMIEFSLGAGKDEREQQFFIGFFGDTVTPFKRNYVLLAPLRLGIEQRLFQTQIEDNFRPFVQLAVGPTAAYQWPYFDDLNENGLMEAGEDRLGPFSGIGRGEFRLGAGGMLAVGAYFGRSRRTAQGVRFGYAGDYFFREVELLEPDPDVEDPSRRFFGTPIVSFHFVRLVN